MRLKAEQVVVVNVVGELLQALVEALLRREVDVLSTGESGEFVGCIFLQGVHCHDKKANRSTASAVLQIVQNLRFSWAKGNGVDHGVGSSERGNDLCRLLCAAVIAG